MSASTAVEVQHEHVWRMAEVEFVDSHSLDRYECFCGAIHYVYGR